MLLATVGAAGGLFVLASVPPTAATFYPRCQLHTLTGLHCPGCGTTRALHALLNGHVAQALAYNALTFVVLPVVGWSLLHSLWLWERRRPVPRRGRWANGWLWVLMTVVVAYGVLRNIPAYPFTLLAPHEL